jgi:hypothetical protein
MVKSIKAKWSETRRVDENRKTFLCIPPMHDSDLAKSSNSILIQAKFNFNEQNFSLKTAPRCLSEMKAQKEKPREKFSCFLEKHNDDD